MTEPIVELRTAHLSLPATLPRPGAQRPLGSILARCAGKALRLWVSQSDSALLLRAWVQIPLCDPAARLWGGWKAWAALAGQGPK